MGIRISRNTHLKIIKNNDGRIEPVGNAEKLEENDLDIILKYMNFKDKDLINVPIELKRQFVLNGGIKVDTEIESTVKYHSLTGDTYTVAEDNIEEIELIKIKDEKKLKSKKNVGIASMGSVSDGIFTATSTIIYLGKTPNNLEFKYDYYTSYNWSGQPNFYFTDRIAQSWQSNTTSVITNGAHNRRSNSYPCSTAPITYTTYSPTVEVDGSTATINLWGTGCQQFGALHDEVRIPVSDQGLTGTFVAGYAHPWIGGVVGVTLTYLGIDFASFTGDEYSWRNTFTIGSSS